MNIPFIKTEKIRFQHIDYAGIVFYPRFLEMLNGLVEDWFAEALDRPFEKMHTTHGIPTVDLKVQFKKPARLGEILTKKLWVINLGGASLLCGFRFEDSEGKTCVEGEVTLVNVAFKENRDDIKAEPFSEEMKGKITPFIMQ
ncbi:thioesterase family protein [Flavobacterium sp. GT3R68]|uniref:acyl-CoA thioesterase n=1 Tax=Flavobacterium sp. GT3R68 TaxID=2594437 RepID=UPI000F86C890|nr:acyl-CoA thioesterase [Flavobacterium sp. GT3R68]RTY93646.1 acyl-CoA thioesterase [Flavobacterium sp. GSN2]TRW91633.1 acyl-CoA thioesterase [Flavobacterium sp. GT3R68]